MEGVRSYEQRSVSQGQREHNRLVVSHRRDLQSIWSSTSDQQQEPAGRQLVSSSSRSGSVLSSSSLDDIEWGPFSSNHWITSKYTLWNFLPRNLFEQFRRFANFYFLTTALLQLVLPFSLVGPTTSFLPLFFVVCTTSIKQAYEDYLRHKTDKELNNRFYKVLRASKLHQIKSKDIRVGDVVYIRNNEEIPCDLVLLDVAGSSGSCHITTANLDGEMSLKTRSCFQIRDQIGSIHHMEASQLLLIECERPNATLYEFHGCLRVPKSQRAYLALVDGLPGCPRAGGGNNEPNPDSASDATSSHMFGPTNRSSHASIHRVLTYGSHNEDGSYIAWTVSTLSRRSKRIRSSMTGPTVGLHAQTTRTKGPEPGSPAWFSSNELDCHEIPLDLNNLLLRGARLRNTRYIYGLAIYTGSDTKLAHNSQVKPNKFSSTESRINLFLMMAFLTVITCTLIGAFRYSWPDRSPFWTILAAHFLLYNYLIPISLYVTLEFVKFFGTSSVVDDKHLKAVVWQSLGGDQSKTSEPMTRTEEKSKTGTHSLQQSAKTKFKTSNNTKSKAVGKKEDSKVQSIKILADVEESHNKDADSGHKLVETLEGPKVNSSDLNEDLGQIQVLFSDKTGTLTENRMLFAACSVRGELFRCCPNKVGLYLQPRHLFTGVVTPLARQLASRPANRHTCLGGLVGCATTDNGQDQPQDRSSNFKSTSTFDHRRFPAAHHLKATRLMESHESLIDFFICLCLCSTINLNERLPLSQCLPNRVKASGGYNFQLASPDEESLISAAHASGVTLCKADERDFYLAIDRSSLGAESKRRLPAPQKGVYKALVETDKSNELYLVRHFRKLQVFEFNSARKRMSVIYRDCDNECILMAAKGSEEMLDCLNLDRLDSAYERSIDLILAHLDAFAKSGLRTLLVARRLLEPSEFELIETELQEARQSIQFRDQMMRSATKRVEIQLELIGATAVEDTLQEWVPETVASLREAGIKLWLLTGDKVETAISVAYLCSLLDHKMLLLHLVRQRDLQNCKQTLASLLDTIERFSGSQQNPSSEKSPKKYQSFALIADGRSLYFAMRHAEAELDQLYRKCACFLGCRLSPIQKAEIVAMIKRSQGAPITAAIGDGANDVSMIQEAHVGIGIRGREGRQAVNSSDFAISRFHMLRRLLFVHGHLFYHRAANTVHYFFYKNVLFIVPQFLFTFHTLSEASSIYQPVHLISYNLFFTSIPVLIYGLWEVHIPERLLDRYPRLYSLNRNNSQLKLSVFLGWTFMATIQATLAFYVLFFNFDSRHIIFLLPEAQEDDKTFGLVLYFAIVISVTFKLYLLARNHSLMFHLGSLLSCILLPLGFSIYAAAGQALVSNKHYHHNLLLTMIEPTFWMAVATCTAAAILPDCIWLVWNRLKHLRALFTVIRVSSK